MVTSDDSIFEPQVKIQEEILESLNRLRSLRILVVGDLFLDSYLTGSIHRISPEAPVPILNVEQNFFKPGGAGNVALNLAAMGNEAILLSRIGDDLIGHQLISLLKAVDTTEILKERDSKTGQKQRVISHQQQLLRIDWEKIEPLSAESELMLLQRAARLMPSVDIVALSDYGKGICTPSFTASLIQMAQSFDRSVVVDPKGGDFQRYSGAAIVKPNLAELYSAIDPSRQLSLHQAATAVLSSCPTISKLLVTRSDQGMTLFDQGGNRIDVPAHFVKINDVTGAGDTAFAMLAHSWGCGLRSDQCALLANCAAGIAVQQLGCAQVTLAEMANSVARFSQLCKTIGKLSPRALKAHLEQKPALLIIIDSEMLGLNHLLELIDLIEQLESRPMKVALYCSDQSAGSEVLRIARSLKEIDFFFSEKEDLLTLISLIEWSAIYRFKDEKFIEIKGSDAPFDH